MRFAAAMALILLSGCGVDGAPERPERPVKAQGITISGDYQAGVRKEGI